MDLSGCWGLLLLSSFLLDASVAVQCIYQQCACDQNEIDCSDRQMVTIPKPTAPTNTYFANLIFDRNNFTAITSGSLLPNLTSISFVETPITTIDDDAFDGSANTLTSLFFLQARFIQLPAAFGHLNVLSFLSIGESSIEDWNLEALKPIGASVGTLALDKLTLKEWPSWLQLFTNLTDLGISGCRISSIPDNGLDAQKHILTDLTLNNNSLKTVPKAVSYMTALRLLALDKNKIADVNWLPQSSNLTSLSLNGNKLHNADQLSDRLKVYADTLSDFNIQSNDLTSFPKLDFLVHVSSLDFVHNKLVDPNSGSLPVNLTDLKMKSNALPRIPRILSSLHQITQVWLGSNAITALEGTAFPPFSRGVELENNRITDIGDTSFPFNSSITYILLNNNPLVSISENAFLNLPHLVELQVQYTKLTRMPMALRSLDKIDVIYFTNIESLVCTCMEKSLQDWIKLMRPEMVKGTCGEVSILYFFTVLSPECP
jgi:Leucine-rich repeat (LRR) protein